MMPVSSIVAGGEGGLKWSWRGRQEPDRRDWTFCWLWILSQVQWEASKAWSKGVTFKLCAEML